MRVLNAAWSPRCAERTSFSSGAVVTRYFNCETVWEIDGDAFDVVTVATCVGIVGRAVGGREGETRDGGLGLSCVSVGLAVGNLVVSFGLCLV